MLHINININNHIIDELFLYINIKYIDILYLTEIWCLSHMFYSAFILICIRC